MLQELSLHVLDIVNNSIRANATFVEIAVCIHRDADKLSIVITDNGCGMTKEQLEKVTDPFYTTRTTRDIGLGVPFFKQAALITGGDFSIVSESGIGTSIKAEFRLSHIDRMPLGDINSTIHTLIITNKQVDFLYTYEFDGRAYHLDTREFRKILGDIPMDLPEVSKYIKEYLEENQKEVDGGYLL